MNMGMKGKITKSLRSATSDKEDLNRQVLKLHKCFKEVEKELSRGKKSK